jgi:alcohol dehydrogenase (NADP+)
MAATAPPAGTAPLLKLNNGRTMPAIGFGTWRCDSDKLETALTEALRVGYRHFDCAPIYRNEPIVGRALKAAIDGGLTTREQLFVTSKLP